MVWKVVIETKIWSTVPALSSKLSYPTSCKLISWKSESEREEVSWHEIFAVCLQVHHLQFLNNNNDSQGFINEPTSGFGIHRLHQLLGSKSPKPKEPSKSQRTFIVMRPTSHRHRAFRLNFPPNPNNRFTRDPWFVAAKFPELEVSKRMSARNHRKPAANSVAMTFAEKTNGFAWPHYNSTDQSQVSKIPPLWSSHSMPPSLCCDSHFWRWLTQVFADLDGKCTESWWGKGSSTRSLWPGLMLLGYRSVFRVL